MNKQTPSTPCKDRRFKSRRKKRFCTLQEEQQRKNVVQLIHLQTARKATSFVNFPDDENMNTADINLSNQTESQNSYLDFPKNRKSVDLKTTASSPQNIKPQLLDSPMSLEKKPSEVKSIGQDATTTPAGNKKESKELKTLARRLSFLSPFRNIHSQDIENKENDPDPTHLEEPNGFDVFEEKRLKSFASSFDASMSSYLDASLDTSMRPVQIYPAIPNPFLRLVDGESSDESRDVSNETFQKQRSSSLVNEEMHHHLHFPNTVEIGRYSSIESNPKSCQQFLQLSRYTRDFEELDVLGSGSFGKVYKCRARLDGCLYAVKLISRKCASPCERNRGIKEIHAMAAFSKNPRFVRYYSSWEEDNVLYIQMEYCQQGSVMSLWENEKLIFNTANLVNFLRQVLQGLCYLHDRQVVHLDMKPENIYLTNDGMYKIGDFGLVTCLADGEQSCPSIGKDILEGDSRYLPLELLEDNYEDLKKADIFSLGLSAYELARPPNNPLPRAGEEWHKIRSSKLEPLKDISPDVLELLQWMTRKEPIQRPCAKTALAYLEKIAVKELHEG